MRTLIENLQESRIREVANAGMGRSDVLAFWFGESDEVTPATVREAAARSLHDGETFYSHNLGLMALRQDIAGYLTALHGAVTVDRIAVTPSGVSALMLASQMLVSPGDEVVAVVPVWPNLTAQPAILSAEVKRVSLQPGPQGWSLDLGRLLDAVTQRTRVLLVNAPNNPTGWTLTRDEQVAILAHCRRTGTWIVADEVYERIWFAGGEAAPSFLDVAAPDDRLVVAHSFSKSFLMTGWRLGWLVLPPGLEATVSKLAEFNSSCSPVFVQRAGQAALAGAGQSVASLVQRLRQCRDTLYGALSPLPGVQVSRPDGGMYLFFRVEGEGDSLALAKRLVAGHGLGLAPGVAFGPEGEGWLRWCFASRDTARLLDGAGRLRSALGL